MKNVGLLVGAIAVLFALSTASAATWYVHPDSTLNSIQDGIDLCSTGDTVLVGAGTYEENINFNGMAITVMSEYGADTTIIDGGSPAHPDTGSVVLFVCSEDTTSVLKGFTLTNGTGTLDPVEGRMGGGIICINASSPSIESNIITGNSSYFAGGIGCYTWSSPSIRYNTISANIADASGGGIEMWISCSPTIMDNSISNNSAGNYAGGIQCFDNCSPLIINNDIMYNSCEVAGGAIRVSLGSSPVIRNNRIEGDTALNGGGIFCDGGSSCSPHISQNVISNNIATNYCGGILCEYNAAPIIDSCLISYNVGDEICCRYAGNPIVHYNNIIDSVGYGLVNTDPSVIVYAEYNWWGDSTGPYHTTNPSGQGVAVSDYVDFDPWLQDSVQGIGIQEIRITEPCILSLHVVPNPFRHFASIRYTITDPGYTMQHPILRIYDAVGRLVKQWDYPTIRLSDHVNWDGTDRFNRQVSSGVYFLKLQAGDYQATEKILLIR